MSDNTGFGVMVYLTLNDLKGGTATITMYNQQNGAWVPVGGNSGSRTYDGSGDDDVFGDYFYDESLYDRMDTDNPVKYNSKIVVDYTYPDGTTGSLESSVFEQCAGNFAKVQSVSITASNARLTAEFTVDLSLVDMAHVSYFAFAYYSQADGYTDYTELDTPQLVSSEAGNGVQRMVFEVQLTNMPEGVYNLAVEFTYNGGRGPEWRQVSYGQTTY